MFLPPTAPTPLLGFFNNQYGPYTLGQNDINTALNYIPSNLSVPVEQFGAKGNGIVDDTEAFIKGVAYLTNNGGGNLSCINRYLIDSSSIYLPEGVNLVGFYQSPISFGNLNDYSTCQSTIILNPNYSIYGNGSSGISGLLFLMKTFQIGYEVRTGYNGIAFNMLNSYFDNNGMDSGSFNTGYGNSFVVNSSFMGFNQAINSQGMNRVVVDNLTTDCITAVWLENCFDITRINRIHQTSYLAASNISANNVHNPGPFIHIEGGGSSWQHITNCFSWSSDIGFSENNSGNNVYTNCGVDGAFNAFGGVPLTTGISFLRTGSGATSPSQYIGCQTTSNYGFYASNNDGNLSYPSMQIVGGQAWGPSPGQVVYVEANNWVNISGFLIESATGMSAGTVLSGGLVTISGSNYFDFGDQAGIYSQSYYDNQGNFYLNTNSQGS